MLPRPLHRWKSFWAGILVLTFLSWGWIRSSSRRDGASWSRGPVTYGIMHDRLGFGIYQVQLPTSLDQGLQIHRQKVSRRGGGPLPSAIQWRNDGIPDLIKHRSVHFAHWFLILLFLIPWTGFLFRRARRLDRPRPPGRELNANKRERSKGGSS
jgi:hypothetical protein